MIDIVVPATPAELWAATHAERAALVDQLARLTPAQWATRALCADWTVEETVAHLSACASVGRFRWIASMLGARFDDGVHNRRRLDEQLRSTPEETLAVLRGKVGSTVAPIRMPAAWLGEVVIHGADVRRPLGLPEMTPVATSTAVARFLASRDFTVNGRSAVAGLRVEAVDGPFVAGDEGDPRVAGPTLALLMAMAGRTAFLDDLAGPGAATLRERTVRLRRM